ncbi:MAG: DUF2807 domain-containing protein [Bacteroidetes bacterium]|nr:DUF2807 domain-containing protein [Bacteroidota bacterium]
MNSFKNNKTMKTIAKIKLMSFAVVLIATLFALQGCNLACSRNAVKGDGNVLTVNYDVYDFKSIDIRGMFNVILAQGEKEQVVLETDGNLHELISVDVKDNKLIIKTTKEKFINPTKMNLYIYFKEINVISSGGACTISATSCIDAQYLSIDLSGATEINLELKINELTTNASGASNINFSGNANTHNIALSGAGKIKADNLFTNSTNIRLSGAGSAYVHADEYLDAKISGVGSVYYAGDPDKKNIEKSGLGSVSKI